jgi:hypothetical protein
VGLASGRDQALKAHKRELYADLLQAAEEQRSGKRHDSVEDLIADLNRDDGAV